MLHAHGHSTLPATTPSLEAMNLKSAFLAMARALVYDGLQWAMGCKVAKQ
jgi:hypothetical protein